MSELFTDQQAYGLPVRLASDYLDGAIHQDPSGLLHFIAPNLHLSILPDGETQVFFRQFHFIRPDLGFTDCARVVVAKLDHVHLMIKGGWVIIGDQDLNLNFFDYRPHRDFRIDLRPMPGRVIQRRELTNMLESPDGAFTAQRWEIYTIDGVHIWVCPHSIVMARRTLETTQH